MEKQRLTPLGIFVLLLPGIAVAYFSTSPRYVFKHSNESGLAISLKHTTKRKHPCTDEERAEYLAKIRNLKHSRNVGAQCGSRERFPMDIKVDLDGAEIWKKEITPSGLSKDSVIYVFEKFFLTPGRHRLDVAIRDSGGDKDHYDYRYDGIVDFGLGKLTMVGFNGTAITLHQ